MNTYRVTVSLLTILLTLSCGLTDQFAPPTNSSANEGAHALLNEVLFMPGSAQSPFVELKGSDSGASLKGLNLTTDAGQTYALPDGLSALAPDQFLLIVFDDQGGSEPATVHGPQGFLDPESGWLELRSEDGMLLDRVAWGPDQAGAVSMSKGGIVDELAVGTTIGRHPESLALDLTEWTIFSPTQVTPGAANVQPGVEVMLPLTGAILSQTSLEVTWYPVPGAASYQVQVSSDEAFGTLIVDEATTTPELMVDLQPGTYFWRVQAVGPDGAEAQLSPTQSLTIDTGVASAVHLASLLPQDAANLAVPMIMQHKDTGMLLLESKRETGDHAWGAAHPGLDRSDPADKHNCVLASVAMINNFLGGDLSQDRIGYEVHKDAWPGPEYDLNYAGLYADQVLKALNFALNSRPDYHPSFEDADTFWAEIGYEITFGRPVIATVPGHAFVITGFAEHNGKRIVKINDPWWGAYAADLDAVNWGSHFLIQPGSIPVVQEAEVTMDSDEDGIVNFDETERLGTNPDEKDTEKDNLEDKDDVRGSLFDEKFGYAAKGNIQGRDFDGDGLSMELDVDSDAGGCFDGLEDYNYDGKYLEPETWNFDDGDDACLWGTEESVVDGTTFDSDVGYHQQRAHTFITFSATVLENGKLQGLAQIEYAWTGAFSGEECSGTHAIDPGFYGAKLSGEFSKLPGSAGTFFTLVATPDRGEPLVAQWYTNCPAEPTPTLGWTWGGVSGTLKDGVYDFAVDYSGTPGMAEFWTKIHVEQAEAR